MWKIKGVLSGLCELIGDKKDFKIFFCLLRLLKKNTYNNLYNVKEMEKKSVHVLLVSG